MDLFTKRCGCGAIFKPAVNTARACTKCTFARESAQRERLNAERDAARARAREQQAAKSRQLYESLVRAPKSIFQKNEDAVLGRYEVEPYERPACQPGSAYDIEWRMNEHFAGHPVNTKTLESAWSWLSFEMPTRYAYQVEVYFDHVRHALRLRTRLG